MRQCFVLLLNLMLISKLFAGPGDTLRIPVINFSMRGDVKEKWVVFPDSSHQFSKILMYYTLKCDPQNTPYKCGEWDYLTYTYASLKTGKFQEFPNYKVDDEIIDSFAFVRKTGWNYTSRLENRREIKSIANEKTFILGDSTSAISSGINMGKSTVKCQYLWIAADLFNAGLSKNNIEAIYLYNNQSAFSGRITVKMMHTQATFLQTDSIISNGFSIVYDQNTNVSQNGWFPLVFNKAFSWDSSSNILFEIDFHGTSTPFVFNLSNDTFI